MTHVQDQNTHAITSRRSQRMPHHRSATGAILLAVLIAAPFVPRDAFGASLMPQGKHAYFDANGDPLAGGKIYTYSAGTTTPLATYSDQAGSTPNANPVVLDARGEATIFWGTGPYKVSLYTSADVLVWTVDNLYPSYSAASALLLYSGGNAAAPELSWIDDVNSGFYSIGEDNVGLALGGTKRWDYAAAGSTLTGTLTVSGATTLQSSATVTGSVIASTGVNSPNHWGTGGASAQFGTYDAYDANFMVSNAIGFAVQANGTNDNKARRLVNLATPTASTDAATKAYVDGLVDVATTTMSAGTGFTLSTNSVRASANVVTIHMHAVATTGGAYTSIATVPSGYRPAAEAIAACKWTDNGTPDAFYWGQCAVSTGGVISMPGYFNVTGWAVPSYATDDEVQLTLTYVR